ncbi:hypothetical protein CA850_28770 [Micromonospora echinospora]|nr:hypothetical protein CA850_28770 [Micromonospora echinospora]
MAAAHWLQAAADLAAEASKGAATDVLLEADDIEALPHETPTAVLELMEIGLSPTDAVTSMICDAMAIAEGEAPDIDELREKIEEAEEEAEQVRPGGAEAVGEFTTIRLTTLDPLRPARDMLEDLLSGIYGCWLLYREYAMSSAKPEDNVSDDEPDDELEEAFRKEVRARAAVDRHRLDLEDRK